MRNNGNMTLKLKTTTLIMLFSYSLIAQTSSLREIKKDTIKVFHDNIKVLLPIEALEIKKTKALVKEFKSQFAIKKLRAVAGYTSGKKRYSFFYTDINYPSETSHEGLNNWKLFAQFTDKVINNHWIGSGWEIIGNKRIYHIELSSFKKEESTFQQFSFFNLKGKLAVLIYECPLFEGLKSTESLQEAPRLVTVRSDDNVLHSLSIRI